MTSLYSPPPPFPKPSALVKQRLSSAASSDEGTSNKPAISPSHHDPNTPIDHIPGEPGTDLTEVSVYDFLCSELNTTLLDELYNHLWLIARKSGTSIEPLNRQRVKRREIVASEDVRLHLTWHRNRIYVKPMPLCLLNYDFWVTHLPLPAKNTTPQKDNCFMRSYALLVRHHIDFVLARESHLFPAEFTWDEWSHFITHFRRLEDEDVAKRYHYGQLRLSRLNWVVRLCRPSSAATFWFYEVPHWSTGDYVERAIAPLVLALLACLWCYRLCKCWSPSQKKGCV